MGASKDCDSPYENARNHRVEENKKRLQELGLTDLSRDLIKSATPPKGSPNHGPTRARASKERVTIQLRRSTRHSGGPQPDYVEVEIDIRRRVRFDNTGGPRHYSRLYERKYASDEARMCATDKAEALKKKLPETNVSFVKPMLQSHVTGGFWLGLPVAFCRDHLPKKDDRIVLEDEKNEEWETIYLSYKTGLSGGWRGFSLDHGLVDGDALVFELVEPRRFKVHIIRVYGPVNGEEQGLQSDGKEGHSKVRQKLIWETEHEDGTDTKANPGFEATDDTKCGTGNVEGTREKQEQTDNALDDFDCKPDVHIAQHNCVVKSEKQEQTDNAMDDFDCKPDVHIAQHNCVVKSEKEWDAGVEDAKNADLLGINITDENRHLMPSKRPKKNGELDVNITVKKDVQTGNDDGFNDVKDVVRLFDSNSSNLQMKDITSYMRSKKHCDVDWKDKETLSRRLRERVVGFLH